METEEIAALAAIFDTSDAPAQCKEKKNCQTAGLMSLCYCTLWPQELAGLSVMKHLFGGVPHPLPPASGAVLRTIRPGKKSSHGAGMLEVGRKTVSLSLIACDTAVTLM